MTDIDESMEYVKDFYTCMDGEGLDREDIGRHFRNVYGLAYQKLNGYAVHNTEVLLFVMGFQGGTVHQVAKYLETTTDDILYADNERMQDLMRKAQKLGRSRKLSEEKMSEAIFGAGNHDFNPESAVLPVLVLAAE